MIKRYNSKILVCGIDEAGRGALSGPVTISSVILPKNYYNPEIKDSKKLSYLKRKKLFDEIKNVALDYVIVDVDNNKIDNVNILNATFFGMNKSIKKLNLSADIYLIDGNKFQTKMKLNYKCIIGGDNLYQSIAAASILSKVHRDKYMAKIGKRYPQFDWVNNKGYGTKKHIDSIKKYGYTKYHRNTFKIKGKQLSLEI
jgi:ribonuclease HII|tara:strand:- start:1042 stop:1638 length:597 start_codon:yes stop_codon:yes gene_type:complete